MGGDAVLVESRKAPPESRHLGEYEVVFACDAPVQETAEASSPVSDRLASEVAQLKQEIDNMRRTLTRTAYSPASFLGASPSVVDAYAQLTASGIDEDLAREIAESAEARMTNTATNSTRVTLFARPVEGAPRLVSKPSVEQFLAEELESRFQVQPALGRGESKPRIVAMVGPPGSGKTTTLIKLAVNYGLASRRPILLLSMDTYRIAAAEQLRSFAAILGVGVQILETVNSLAQTIEENRLKELIFVDTPGLTPNDQDDGAGLAQFLSGRNDIDTQLVLPASMKSADLSRTVRSFDAFQAQRLIFTRMDETTTFGSVFNQAARTGKPLSFFSNGQRIPEDLEEATSQALTGRILNASSSRDRQSKSARLG
jgi:flagellar biosynthesis protein FlhF